MCTPFRNPYALVLSQIGDHLIKLKHVDRSYIHAYQKVGGNNLCPSHSLTYVSFPPWCTYFSHLFFAPIDALIDDAEPFPSGGALSYEPVRVHNAAVRATGGPHSTVGRPDQR